MRALRLALACSGLASLAAGAERLAAVEETAKMSSTSPPAAPQPAVCYRCGQPMKGVCRFCGKFFCYMHGGPGMLLCQRHWRITAAVGLVVTLVLIAGTLIAAVMRSQQ